MGIVRASHDSCNNALDTPGIDGDVLSGRAKADEHGQHRHQSKLFDGVAAGQQAQASDDERLTGEHPGAPMSEPSGEPRHARAIDKGCPEELERVHERCEAEEPDDLERQALVTQPGGQRVEDEQERQAGGEAERHHHQRWALGVHRQRLASTAGRSVRFEPFGWHGRDTTQILRRSARRGPVQVISQSLGCGGEAGDADALQKYRDQLDKRAYQLNAASVRLTREIQKVWVPDAKKAEADRLRVNAEQHPQSLWIGIGAG